MHDSAKLLLDAIKNYTKAQIALHALHCHRIGVKGMGRRESEDQLRAGASGAADNLGYAIRKALE